MPDPNMPDLAQAMERLKDRIADIALRETKAKKLDEQAAALTARAEKLRTLANAERAELDSVFAVLGIGKSRAPSAPRQRAISKAALSERMRASLDHFRRTGKPFENADLCAYMAAREPALLHEVPNFVSRIGACLRSMAHRKRLTVTQGTNGKNCYAFPDTPLPGEAAPLPQKLANFRSQVIAAIRYLEDARSLVTPRAIREVLTTQGMSSEEIRQHNLNACLHSLKRDGFVAHARVGPRGSTAAGEYKLTDAGRALAPVPTLPEPLHSERSA